VELPALLELCGRGTTLHLLDPALSGETLVAQGHIATISLKRGRVFRFEKRRYRLLQRLEAGVHVVPLTASEPIALEAVSQK
jgi:hypothetical protein